MGAAVRIDPAVPTRRLASVLSVDSLRNVEATRCPPYSALDLHQQRERMQTGVRRFVQSS